MPRQILSTPIEQFWGGPSVTLPANNSAETIQRVFNVPPGAAELLVIPSETARIALCPKVVDAYLVTSTDLTRVEPQRLRDFLDPRDAGSLQTRLATTTFLVLGLNNRTAGIWFEIGTANAVASTPVVEYATANGQWTALTVATDGTTSGGATLATNGNMVWTVPSAVAWPALRLRNMGGLYVNAAQLGTPLHWLRISASGTLTATTSLAILGIMHFDAAVTDANGHSGFLAATTEYSIPLTDTVGGVELRTRDASAGTMTMTWIFKGR